MGGGDEVQLHEDVTAADRDSAVHGAGITEGVSPVHLYRHDLESLFYVMLLTAAHHTVGTPEREKNPRVLMRRLRRLPYRDWFNQQRYDVLGLFKGAFFEERQAVELSPVFEDFRPWLECLQYYFSRGFIMLKALSKTQVPQLVEATVKPVAPEFDDETLGGHITHATIMTAVPYLSGELEGLIIRDPKSPSAPTGSTSAGASRAND